MDAKTVAMLELSLGLVDDLPPDIEALVSDDEWWEKLEETPLADLTPEQLMVIAALGVDLGEE